MSSHKNGRLTQKGRELLVERLAPGVRGVKSRHPHARHASGA